MKKGVWNKIISVGGAMMIAMFLLVPFAEATWVTGLRDTMSSQVVSALSNHSFSFVSRSGAGESSTIVLTFDSGFDTSSINSTDVDLAVGGVDRTLAANCSGTEQVGVSVASDVFTFLVMVVQYLLQVQ